MTTHTDYISEYNERVSKHNKRVESIREKRLPKSCVVAIDEAIKTMDSIHGSLIDGVVHGYHPMTLHDVIMLVEAVQKLKHEFEYREER